MGYRLEWRFVGRENRLLDSGEIDNGFRDRRSALEALGAFLHQFALWGRDIADNSWWARRSADADLKVHISLREQMPSEVEMMPALWAARQSERGSLAA
jgi:hypothetical protein